MNRVQIIRSIAAKSRLPQSVVKLTLAGLEEIIGEALDQDAKVTLAGFGSFYVREWGGYVSSQTGRPVALRRKVRFSAGSRLKEAARIQKAAPLPGEEREA